MPIPRVAIVGRPNVGKSSLLNMLARAKVSIVDPTPGVTRDRVSAIVHLEDPERKAPDRVIEFVDTGGFGVYVAEGERFDDIGNDLTALTGDIEAQIGAAVGDADMVLFAVDSQAGVTPQDREIARMLREGKFAGSREEQRNTARPPIRVVATKVDGQKWEPHALEISGLGFGEPIMCSAKSNYFRHELMGELYRTIPEAPPSDTPEVDRSKSDLKIAIIGKRNAGKSTLVNTLAGEPRVIVSEIPGTTRDAVDVRFEFDGKVLTAIDTAGLRRKRSFAGPIEWYAFDRLKLSVDRADVVLLMIDATLPVSQVDQQVAMLAQKAYKPAVIVVNKWDLAEGKPGPKGKKVTLKDFEEYIRAELKGLWYAPIAFMSGKDGTNVKETVGLAFDLREQALTRVRTGPLNRLMRAIVERQGPPSKIGARAKVYYVAQTGVDPPTIVMVVNKPELFTPNYQRFLLNRVREEGPFPEVPIRIVVRERKRDDAADREWQSPEVAGKQTAEELFAEDFAESVEVAAPTDEELAKAAELDDAEIDIEDAEAYFKED